MNKYNFRVEWSEGDEGYIATCPAFPRISGFGDTPEEALAEVQVALELAIEAYTAHGRPLPEPSVLNEYSGKFQLRIPKQLHAQLVVQAVAEGVSLNTLAVSYLSQGVGANQATIQLEATVVGKMQDIANQFRQEIQGMSVLRSAAGLAGTRTRRVEIPTLSPLSGSALTLSSNLAH